MDKRCPGPRARKRASGRAALPRIRCNQLIQDTNWDPKHTRRAQATASRDRHLPRTNCTVLTHTDEHTECTVDSAVRSDAPPQTEVSITERLYAVRVKGHASFMISLRRAWNWLADLEGLVKKSARLFIRGANKGHLDLKGLNHVAYKEMATLNMLHAVMMLRVV